MLVDKYELGKKMIALASQYRQMGDQLSIDAFEQLKAGSIDKNTYNKLHDNVDKIFAQAIAISRQVAALTEGSIDADLTGIEDATEDLKKATDRIAKTRNIVNVALEAITAIGTILIACTAPNPAAILAAVQATKTLADDITNSTDSTGPKLENK
jgi:hypothetical protein